VGGVAGNIIAAPRLIKQLQRIMGNRVARHAEEVLLT